jgi:uncharacterized membrane protein
MSIFLSNVEISTRCETQPINDKFGVNINTISFSQRIFGQESTKIKKELNNIRKRLAHPWILTAGVLILVSLVLCLFSIYIESLYFQRWGYSLIPATLGWLFLVLAIVMISLTLRQVSVLGIRSHKEELDSEKGEKLTEALLSFKPLPNRFSEIGIQGDQRVFITFSQNGQFNKRIKIQRERKEPITMIVWSKEYLSNPLLGLVQPKDVSIDPLYNLKYLPEEKKEYQEKEKVAEVHVLPLLNKGSITLIPLIGLCFTSRGNFHV